MSLKPNPQPQPPLEKKMHVCRVNHSWYVLELKIFISALFLIFSAVTLLHYLPSKSFSPSNLSPPPLKDGDDDGLSLTIKRSFNPYGSAAYSFILMSSYRGGTQSFAVIGLSSKPLHVFGHPTYTCQYIGAGGSNITTQGSKILPDWGYGRVYTVVVINCSFPEPIAAGGTLFVHALDSVDGPESKIQALVEPPNTPQLNFSAEPVYDYLYCGSPLYGNLSPQRVREWLAYHIRLFGEKSHFVIYDAGGVHLGVYQVLKPWIEKGYVTLHDIRTQERFDGYYHNQFLVVNDCLFRYRFMAKWMYFFDVDEYIYVPSGIKLFMDSMDEFTQFTIEQMPMSNKLCLASDAGRTLREWGFEKLVYRDVKRGVRRDRKYAIQPRNVLATGVHMSQNVVGRTQHKIDGRIKYYHYHGTVSERREPCRQLVNETELLFERKPHVLDTSLRDEASAVKRFELRTIGYGLIRTRQ